MSEELKDFLRIILIKEPEDRPSISVIKKLHYIKGAYKRRNSIALEYLTEEQIIRRKASILREKSFGLGKLISSTDIHEELEEMEQLKKEQEEQANESFEDEDVEMVDDTENVFIKAI